MKEKRRKQLAGLAHFLSRFSPEEAPPPTRPTAASQIEQDEGPAAPVKKRSPQTYLIVGLGNPGREYADNRHNVGFMLVDYLAEKLDIQFARMQQRALVADTRYKGHKLILVKPQTYMNESGQSVAALARFYKIPNKNIIVAFDDMDIPLGNIRIRRHGGSGGQKGMKSIIQRLGNQQNFPRIRLGLSRPPGQMPPPAYLLQDFSAHEREQLAPVLETAADAILTFVTEGLDKAMNRYNGSVDSE